MMTLSAMSGMSGIVRNFGNFVKTQENARKIHEFLVMPGICQEFFMMY